jgi:hypothetical protein
MEEDVAGGNNMNKKRKLWDTKVIGVKEGHVVTRNNVLQT